MPFLQPRRRRRCPISHHAAPRRTSITRRPRWRYIRGHALCSLALRMKHLFVFLLIFHFDRMFSMLSYSVQKHSIYYTKCHDFSLHGIFIQIMRSYAYGFSTTKSRRMKLLTPSGASVCGTGLSHFFTMGISRTGYDQVTISARCGLYPRCRLLLMTWSL